MKKVFGRPEGYSDGVTHYCAGCTQGIASRIVAETINQFNLREKAIIVTGIGCAGFKIHEYIGIDCVSASHGRAPAVATGVIRVLPHKIVFTYQGDGDLTSIGMAETIHAANRGENILIVAVNNAVFAMTGGQMSPTTPLGQKTTTTPMGRGKESGHPIRIAEILANLDGVVYSARVSLHSPRYVIQAKKVIKEAFEMLVKGEGFAFVEILSACPIAWQMSPVEAQKKVEKEMIPVFPLGIFKVTTQVV